MKNFQPILAVLTLVLAVSVISALSPARAAAPSTILDVPVSASFELAVDHVEAKLMVFRDCPCPSEYEEVTCNLDLCGVGILQNNEPDSRRPPASLNPILADDLNGIARQPEHSPPRLPV